MDTPRVKTRHSGRAGIHPKIRGGSFGTRCVHTCAHLYTRNTLRNCTLINSSFGTRWNPYFRTPPIRDALEYTQNGGCVKTREFGTPQNTPQNTRIYNPTHSGRHVGTHCTHNHTQSHTNSHNYTQKNIFPQKFTRTHNIPHTYTHRVRQHSTFSGGTTQAITYKYIYIHIYIYSPYESKSPPLIHHKHSKLLHGHTTNTTRH